MRPWTLLGILCALSVSACVQSDTTAIEDEPKVLEGGELAEHGISLADDVESNPYVCERPFTGGMSYFSGPDCTDREWVDIDWWFFGPVYWTSSSQGCMGPFHDANVQSVKNGVYCTNFAPMRIVTRWFYPE
jgi:hypothetical protein